MGGRRLRRERERQRPGAHREHLRWSSARSRGGVIALADLPAQPGPAPRSAAPRRPSEAGSRAPPFGVLDDDAATAGVEQVGGRRDRGPPRSRRPRLVGSRRRSNDRCALRRRRRAGPPDPARCRCRGGGSLHEIGRIAGPDAIPVERSLALARCPAIADDLVRPPRPDGSDGQAARGIGDDRGPSPCRPGSKNVISPLVRLRRLGIDGADDLDEAALRRLHRGGRVDGQRGAGRAPVPVDAERRRRSAGSRAGRTDRRAGR